MQVELPLFEAQPDDPTVQQFVALLSRADAWMTAAQVLGQMRLLNTDANRRLVRAWAEAAEDVVISGQKGYRHVAKATPEEIAHFSNWMLSQGKKMIRRALNTRRHAHTLVG
jgi:hypothetical protein